MGSSFTNLQVRTDDASAVELALADADALPAYVTGAVGGWVSVYPEATDGQDLERLEVIGAAVSAALAAPVLAVLVHDSDVLVYTLFEAGKVVDKYNSWPGYFEGADLPIEGGDVEAILRHAVPGTTAEAVEALLHDQDIEDEAAPPELQAQLGAHLENVAAQMGGRLGGVDLAQVMGALRGGGGEEGADEDDTLPDADELAVRLGRILGIADGHMLAGWRYVAAGEGPSDVALLEPA